MNVMSTIVRTKKSHILFIDPLTKLNLKKDSTLLLAATLQKRGFDVYLIFEEDFYIENHASLFWNLYTFDSTIDPETFALTQFNLKSSFQKELTADDTIHMRLDPPFDGRYLRYLWMLEFLEQKGIRVVNAPGAVARFNEKIYAYSQMSSHPSFIGGSLKGFLSFAEKMHREGHKDLIVKPLDLYQGMGVEKITLEQSSKDLSDYFEKRVIDLHGALVAQPFIEKVKEGEIRALFFKGIELGSILKIPAPGAYLANIAQGASYSSYKLNGALFLECEKIAKELMNYGVDWIAYDLLDGKISEVNITCPGLLVEVSKAYKVNLAEKIIDLF